MSNELLVHRSTTYAVAVPSANCYCSLERAEHHVRDSGSSRACLSCARRAHQLFPRALCGLSRSLSWLRRRMMRRAENLPSLRVRVPFFMPHGDLSERWPPELFPSPPPIGWSTGFIATPRVVGRRPIQLAAPALPRMRNWWLGFPTMPKVALQRLSNLRSSPDCSLRTTYLSSRDWIKAEHPAARTILPPRLWTSSTLCTREPSGMMPSGK
mmetsp:Transcript_26786/g.58815  ORF Transcript_26786/g.58815 Transcript_26786/m.58815 type:complete len:212 (-) Transcript_26786:740-1375(-)